MIKLTLILTLQTLTKLNLTLNDTYEKITSVHVWDWNLQLRKNLNDSQHANYLRHWWLYDIDVVRRVVYLILTAASITSVSVR